MLRVSIRDVWHLMQTPVTLSRSMFRFSMREVVLVTTIVALVGGLFLERRDHAETQRQHAKTKQELQSANKRNEPLTKAFFSLMDRYERDIGTEFPLPWRKIQAQITKPSDIDQ